MLWVCVSVGLVIQHAMRVRRLLLSSVVCLAVPCFSTLSHKRHDFRKKKKYSYWNKMFFFSTTYFFLKRFSFWGEISEMPWMYVGLHVKYPLLLSDFNETCILWTDFRKALVVKMRPVGVELFHADRRRLGGTAGRRTRGKLIVAFRNSTNTPNYRN
jgi:hypothetical protein